MSNQKTTDIWLFGYRICNISVYPINKIKNYTKYVIYLAKMAMKVESVRRLQYNSARSVNRIKIGGIDQNEQH